MTQSACLERAQQLFPDLKAVDDAFPSSESEAVNNQAETKPDLGQFRMVSTGKFIWDWTLPAPARGKLTCTGDFNTHRIETVNYNGLDKRPAANEVWGITSLQPQSSGADAESVKNMETAK